MSQRIKIDENSKIVIEDNNYILFYRVQDSKAKDERKKWAVAGYFPDLASLSQDWVKNAPARDRRTLTTLQDVVECIQNAESRVTKLIQGK